MSSEAKKIAIFLGIQEKNAILHAELHYDRSDTGTGILQKPFQALEKLVKAGSTTLPKKDTSLPGKNSAIFAGFGPAQILKTLRLRNLLSASQTSQGLLFITRNGYVWGDASKISIESLRNAYDQELKCSSDTTNSKCAGFISKCPFSSNGSIISKKFGADTMPLYLIPINSVLLRYVSSSDQLLKMFVWPLDQSLASLPIGYILAPQGAIPPHGTPPRGPRPKTHEQNHVKNAESFANKLKGYAKAVTVDSSISVALARSPLKNMLDSSASLILHNSQTSHHEEKNTRAKKLLVQDRTILGDALKVAVGHTCTVPVITMTERKYYAPIQKGIEVIQTLSTTAILTGIVCALAFFTVSIK